MRFVGEHYTGLHKAVFVTERQLDVFRSILNDENCNIFSRIKVLKRIGSLSLYATVWETKFQLNSDDISLAIKVQKDLAKTLEEIRINEFLNRWPEYFLQMYGSIYCKNIELKDQKFDNYFMFMELAIADLGQLLMNRNVSEKELLTIISQVFDSIYIMGKSQLFHGDLHIKNVFIVPRKEIRKREENKQIRAVIGDFGETIGIDSITSHTSDIFKFATSLLEFLNVNFKNKYATTKLKLQNIVKYVNKLTPKLEADYDQWNDIHRDDEGNIDFDDLDDYFEKVVDNTIKNIKKML